MGLRRVVAVVLGLVAFLFAVVWVGLATFLDTLQAKSESMVPEVEADEWLLVRSGGSVSLGDVVVVDLPAGPGPSRILVYRLVGEGGDELEGRDGVLVRNGRVVDEPYLADGTVTSDFDAVAVPDGQVFLMGDARQFSTDSRLFGSVASEVVRGRVVYSGLPVARFAGFAAALFGVACLLVWAPWRRLPDVG